MIDDKLRTMIGSPSGEFGKAAPTLPRFWLIRVREQLNSKDACVGFDMASVLLTGRWTYRVG